jgi:hypothetical protein
MSELSTPDGRSLCSLQGLRISHATSAEGASFTAFLSHAAALKLSAGIPPTSILDSDDGTRYRATIHAVTVDKSSAGSALASIRGTVLPLT